MGWLSGYGYRKPLVLTGGASGAQTDFQLDIDVAYAAAMQSDFDCLRFTQADGTTLIDAWLESKVDSASAKTWAEFPTTPANTVEQTYYMYYGKVVANYWDGAATFLDFLDKTSTAGWNDAAGVTIETSGDFLKISTALESWQNPYQATSLPVDEYVCEFQFKNVNRDTDDQNQIDFGDGGVANRFASLVFPAWNNQSTVQLYTSNLYTSYVEETEYIWETHIDETDSSTGVDTYFRDTSRNLLGSLISQSFSSGSPTDLDRLHFRVHASNGGEFYTRWLFFRKYAANPPTYSFGAEESAPTGAIMNQFQKANIGADLYNGALVI